MKKLLSLVLALAMVLSLCACGGSSGEPAAPADPAAPAAPVEANTNTEQTSFKIVSGIDPLSGGYDDNVVLNAMQENAGVQIA